MITILILTALTSTPAPAQNTPCNQGTTYDIRSCWSAKDNVAVAQLKSVYAAVQAEMRKLHADSAPLTSAQAAWVIARDKTCAFEYQLYLPGTIAPQLGVECDVRMTRARTKRLTLLLAALQNGVRPALRAVSPAAQDELDHVYSGYASRVTKSQRASLSAAQTAWLAYRDKACALEGGSCLTDLTKERTTELEASWVGESFW